MSYHMIVSDFKRKLPEVCALRLLIVEDEPMIAEVVAAYAEREGYETRCAPDGETALKL